MSERKKQPGVNDVGFFDEWWELRGRSIDPDTDDVSWFDKRKELARHAYDAAMAHSRSYVANREVFADEFSFANGVKIWIRFDENEDAFLEISKP